jgi:nitrite reductase/ring-hydroxylating ferredoxin subunit
MLGIAGATAATAGGFLGGHLVYRRGAGVDHTIFDAGPAEWLAADDGATPAEGAMVAVTVGNVEVMVTRRNGALCGLADRCSHQGGPLHDGDLVNDRVRCPWHASEFVLTDGSVAHGPASAPQPVYDARNDHGVLKVRRHGSGKVA